MKPLIIALSIVLVSTLAYADILKVSTDGKFTQGVNEVIRFEMPDNCSCMTGEVRLANAALVSITEEYSTKEIDINGNKFVLYGMNKDVMTGANLILTIMPTSEDKISVEVINANGATPYAEAIQIDDFLTELISINDLNGDGLLNADDVVVMIGYVFNDDATAQDLQKIINAILNELP